jgi:hypothetical protein
MSIVTLSLSKGEGRGSFWAIASTFNSIFTSSPTSTPPASRAWFQPRPYSLRLILPCASKPMRWLPHGSLPRPSNVVVRVTSRVVPWTVRLPYVVNASPVPSKRVLLNVIAGYFSASRKSADLRWVSRSGSRVSIVAVSIVTSIDAGTVPSAGTSSVPCTPVKRPRTLAIIMCFTTNSTVVCAGSML